MVRDGRITEAEGEQLIAVLDAAKEADAELQAADAEIGSEARAIEAANTAADTAANPAANSAGKLPEPAQAPLPPLDAPAPTAPAAPAPPHAASKPPAPEAPSASAPQGTRWVSLQMLAGDLDVVVDDGLEEPAVESDGPVDVIIERTNYGFKVSWDQPSGSFLDKVIGKLRSGNLSLRMPPGWGLDLAATAGDVDMVGVPYLRGHLTAGDLDATGLKGIDFTSRAGDIELEAELTSGTHRVNVTAGNVDLRIAPGSSVAIRADASIGDVSNKLLDTKTVSRSLGESLEGTYGGGAARLDVSVTTGSIKLGVGRG